MPQFEPQHIVAMAAAFMSLIGVCFTAWVGVNTRKEAREINKAVNGNKDPSSIRLYDLVLETRVGLQSLEGRVDTMEVKFDRHLLHQCHQCGGTKIQEVA